LARMAPVLRTLIIMTRVSLNLDTNLLIRWLIGLSAVVLLLGYFREAYVALFGLETPLKDLRQIALDTEHCLGSFHSSALMGISSVLMVILGQQQGKSWIRLQWFFLAFVFALMSLDESVSFHEVLIDPLQPLFSFSDFLHFAWIVPGAFFAGVMGLAYLPFLKAMDPATRNRVILAGGLYVTGALGMEAVGGYFNAQGGFDHPLYIAAFMIEETLETLGLTLFAVTLLKLITSCFPRIAQAGVSAGQRKMHVGISQPSRV